MLAAMAVGAPAGVLSEVLSPHPLDDKNVPVPIVDSLHAAIGTSHCHALLLPGDDGGGMAVDVTDQLHLLLVLSATDNHLSDHQLGAELHLHPHSLRRILPVPVTRRAAVCPRVLSVDLAEGDHLALDVAGAIWHELALP